MVTGSKPIVLTFKTNIFGGVYTFHMKIINISQTHHHNFELSIIVSIILFNSMMVDTTAAGTGLSDIGILTSSTFINITQLLGNQVIFLLLGQLFLGWLVKFLRQRRRLIAEKI